MTLKRLDKAADSEVLRYIDSVFVDHTASQEGIFDRLTDQQKVMQLSAVEAKILQVIVALVGAKNIVEIGVLAGYSAIYMANALPKGGMVHAIERDPECVRLAKQHAKEAGVEDRIRFYEGNALDQLKIIEQEGPFDLVFIDADKANYVRYLDWAEQHVRVGGAIVGDNTLLFGHVYKVPCPEEVSLDGYEAMRLFNERLADSSKYTSILIPTIEGMTVGVKK